MELSRLCPQDLGLRLECGSSWGWGGELGNFVSERRANVRVAGGDCVAWKYVCENLSRHRRSEWTFSDLWPSWGHLMGHLEGDSKQQRQQTKAHRLALCLRYYQTERCPDWWVRQRTETPKQPLFHNTQNAHPDIYMCLCVCVCVPSSFSISNCAACRLTQQPLVPSKAVSSTHAASMWRTEPGHGRRSWSIAPSLPISGWQGFSTTFD